QAEDGIRDDLVTGVQTCALPISLLLAAYTTRRTPARRAASSTFSVPVAQTRCVSAGASTLFCTDARAARWNTTPAPSVARATAPDRKSTRLNSSHQIISYAVYCL